MKTYRKFLALYLSFLLLMLCLFVPIYRFFFDAYTQRCIDNSQTVLDEGIAQIERDLGMVHMLTQLIYSDTDMMLLSHISKPLTAKNAYLASHANKKFSGYTAMATNVACLGMIYDNEAVLANRSLYTNGSEHFNLYNIYTGFQDFTAWRDWIYDFEGSNAFLPQKTISVNGDISQGLTYVMGVPLISNSSQKHVLFATFAEEYLLSGLSIKSGGEKNYLVLEDINGTVYYSNAPMDALDGHIPLHAKKLLNYAIKATVYLDGNAIALAVQPIRDIFIMLCVAYILVGVCVSLVYSHRLYKPIKALLSDVFSNAPEHSLSGGNEYVAISDYIKKTGIRMENYKAELASQETQLKQLCLTRMITNGIPSPDQIERARTYFPDFPQSYALTLIRLYYPQSLDLQELSNYRLLVLSIVNGALPQEAITLFFTDEIVIIQERSKVDEKKMIGVKQSILEHTGLYCSIAVSRAHNDIAKLHKAYERARYVIRFNAGDGLGMEDDFDESVSFSLEKNMVNSINLYDCLVRGDVEASCVIINETKEAIIAAPGVSEEIITCAFYEYLAVLARFRDMFQDDGMLELKLPEYKGDQSIQVQFNELSEAVRCICDIIKKRKATRSEDFDVMIVRFIEEKAFDPRLYLRMVTDHFGVTDQYVQNVMKQKTGRSFSCYLEQTRMSKAKAYLQGTQDDINSISTLCGYNSLNTFYKAFKRYYGVAPAKMREMEAAGTG